LVALGAAGWALAVGAAVGFVDRAAARGALLPGVLFLVVVAGARALAFPLRGLGKVGEVSLDAALFLAATACLGAPLTGIGVGVVLTVDGLVRLELRRRRATPIEWLSALYLGGLSAGLLIVFTLLFDVGWGRASSPYVLIPFGLAFLATHYLVQTAQLVLGGHALRAAVRRAALGVTAEASLLPLASVIVQLWDPRRPAAFALLAGTYLLVHFGFMRLAKMAAALKRRAFELETLTKTAEVLGRSLETRQIIPALLEVALPALPGVERLEAVLSVNGQVERYARGAGEPLVPDDEVARRWLRSTGAEAGAETQVAPLVVYGETIGLLVARGHDGERSDEAARLLEAIASQAAAAVYNVRLYGLANIDGLTGLYVRRYFDVRLVEEIERARRFGTSFALILLDLDDFKRLNDTLGHLGGDRALREVAAIAASQLRGVDLAARYGGEELAFLLPRTSLVDAHAVAERIREAVASHVVVESGHSWRITASLGVAGWAESGGAEPSDLIARADAALYRAKRAGKNRVEIDLVAFELTPALAPVRRRAR
jgi:diguanylate cyclase (GGDEF)-like protein